MNLIGEGVYYFFKVMIGFEILQLSFARKTTRKKWILLLVGIIVGVFHAVNVAITTHEFSNTEFFLIILLVALVAVRSYDEKAIKTIGNIWFYYVTEQMLELLLVTLFSIGNITNRGIQLLILSVLLFGAYWIIKKVIQRYDKIHFNLVMIFFIDIIGSILIVYFQRVYLEPIALYILKSWSIFCIYTAFLVGIFFLYEYGKRESLKYKVIKEKNEMLEKSYHNIYSMYKINARLFHDFNAHLYVIRKYLQENEMGKGIVYVDELIKPSEKSQQYVWTKCEIVDLIINFKLQEANEKGKMVEAESDIFEVINISDTDICAIFSNLIDNAIENCITRGPIKIYIKKRNEMLILIISNPIDQSILSRNVRLLTTKKDKIRHGIGLDSVKYSVKKNNGSFEYSVQDGRFEVIITLPI